MVELHEKSLAKGISLLEDGRLEGADESFVRALKGFQKMAAVPEVQSLINEAELLPTRSLLGRKKDDEAVMILTALLKAKDGSGDALNFSAKHLLAEPALHQETSRRPRVSVSMRRKGVEGCSGCLIPRVTPLSSS